MIKLLVNISLIFLIPESGYCQFQISKSPNNKENYELILETFRVTEDARGNVPFKILLEKVNTALELGLTINEVKRDYIIISSSKSREIKIKNRITNVDDVAKFSDFLKPFIDQRLSSLKLSYDYAEFLSDLLLAICNENAFLTSIREVRKIQADPAFHNTFFTKDSIGNFFVKQFDEEFGIRPGDKILSIQNVPCKYFGSGMAYRLLSSIVDHEVSVTIERNGLTIHKILTRPSFQNKPEDKDSLSLTSGTLYIKPKSFLSKNFANKLLSNIQPIDSVEAIILDLQNNEGGMLVDVCDLAGLFLEAGVTICAPKYINLSFGYPEEFKSKPPNPFRQKKVIVLINGRTASGAEIIALALRTHADAQIIGVKSLGYCDIDLGKEINNGNFICRTKVGEYCGPGGLLISGNGIKPDIELAPLENAIDRALKELRRE